MNDVTQVIATLGFPIAMCVILCWYINKRDERTDKTLGRSLQQSRISRSRSGIF